MKPSDFDRYRPLELRGYLGSSPYLDWYLETFYIHGRAWWQ
jgi:hypothetical protein